MGSKAVHQFPQVTDRQGTDTVYGVRYNAGTPEDFSILLDAMGPLIQEATTTIAAADVLTLFTTSQPIAFGVVGKIIVPWYVIITMDGTINYATNTTLIVGPANTIDNTHYILTGTMPPVAFPSTVLFPGFSITGEISSIESGENLHIRMKTGNPTAGDGDLNVRVIYSLIDG